MHHIERDVLADQPAQQHGQVGHRLAEIEHLRAHGLLARECQQLPHQARRPVGILLDLHDVLERRIGRLVGVEQEIGRHHDGAEQVVEVVRDRAGEPADRLHLLLLVDLVLERALLRGLERIDDGGFLVALVGLLDRRHEEAARSARRRRRARLRPERSRPAPRPPGGSRLRARRGRARPRRRGSSGRRARRRRPCAPDGTGAQSAGSTARSGPRGRRWRSPSAYCGRSA